MITIDVAIDTSNGSAILRAPDRTVIHIIKAAPPSLWSYTRESRCWTIRQNAWPAVHQKLVDKGYAVNLHGDRS